MEMRKFTIKVWRIVKSFYYRLFNKNAILREKRLPICNKCEYKLDVTNSESICTQCGCIIKNKVLIKEERCVVNKW